MKLPSSTEIIIEHATTCFFQHGYNAANISMISRYANISRVTIHKQFKSKEQLFRAVVQHQLDIRSDYLDYYLCSEDNFWKETENLILRRCEGLFDQIPNAMIRTDLLHAGQTYCNDLISQHEGEIRSGLTCRLEKEIKAKRITLTHIEMTAIELAKIIDSAPLGNAVSSLNVDNTLFIQNLIKIFKASTAC